MNQICRCQPLLGTFVEITISADCDSQELIDISKLAFDAVNEVHQALSFHDPNSELSRINQNAHLQPIQLSHMAYEVLSLAQQLHSKTKGAYDVSIAPWMIRDGYLPGQKQMQEAYSISTLTDMQLSPHQVFFQQPLKLDLGGIAKGYAIDRAMQVIEQSLQGSLEQASVNAGGDMRVHNWQKFEILVPTREKTMNAIPMKNTALATSSNYYLAGQSGIYDISTGKQIDIPATISVFADQCVVADALTKVVALLGEDDSIFAHYNAEVILT